MVGIGTNASLFFNVHLRMKNFGLLWSVAKNKYLLTLVFFAVWITFFDRNDLLTQYDRKSELQKLEQSKAYYEAEITSTKKELTDLQGDRNVLEKQAREKYFLKKPNEDVFIVVDSTSAKN